MAKTMTAAGNAQIDTAQSKFGGASGLFDGDGDKVTTPNHSDFEFGSGDFSIDCFVRVSTISGIHIVVSRDDSSSYVPFVIAYNNSSTLYFSSSSNGTSWDVASAKTLGTLGLDTWYHAAVVRSGSDFFTFLDGVQGATWTSTAAVVANSNPLAVGMYGATNAYSWLGWIDELRISKNIARWVANFTPPAAAYETDGNTVLLLHCDGTDGSTTFTDSSTEELVISQFMSLNTKYW